ncbi:MAG TPA: DUF4235 domain-containing protein [Acidimicrobiales bacterium]
MNNQAILWKGAGALSGAASGSLTRTALKKGWLKWKGSDPPTNPASPSTKWSEALAWAAASGVAIAVARLVAQRGAAGAWRKATGSYPRGLETVSP